MINGVIENTIPPVMPGIFPLPPYNDSQPTLLGGLCPVCRAYYFPRPKYCRSCLGPLTEVRLGSEGSIYSFTTVRKKAPLGLPLPYSAGFIDLKESGLRIFCLLDPTTSNEFYIGQPVRLAINALGHDSKGYPCLRPYFTPISTKNKSIENNTGNVKV